MLNTIISHYKILEKLGQGGMGIVYKAHDTRLDREVALKFLPHEVAATDEEKSRFLQEARAAATLNHAHIATVYAIEEAEGQQFISMEYVDGVTLRRRINDAGPMKMDDVVALAIQIGDALDQAHQKGIVHRDVKAENIMVNGRNQAKVMDFGLAKLKGSLKLTKTSSTVGTLAYMAPEQIQGGEVDARSDIFSFGVVLFEMLSGQTPFRGEHEAAMMYSILNEEPEPISKYLPDASPELLHVLGRALEKDPEDRYQSVHDMMIDLRRLKKDSSRVSRPVAAAPPAPRGGRDSVTLKIPASKSKIVAAGAVGALLLLLAGVAYVAGFFGDGNGTERLTVAVTDFVNNTSEPELDGLSGMLITSMEQSRRLTVMTRARMFDVLKQLGTEETDRIDESVGRRIAVQAGVDALVSASIRKFGRLYSIDLKVLDPVKDEYLFTAKEEGEGQESIPQMLDRLSEKTRIGLKEKADEVHRSKQELATVTTSNLEAYQHFFQGEEQINRMKFEAAKQSFRRALELDSTFGLAYYRLGYAEGWNSERFAAEHIEKAMSLIDRIPDRERFLLRAEAERVKNGMKSAITVLQEMEERYPDDKEMLFSTGDYLFHTGDNSKAIEYFRRVLSIDPKFERALQHLSWALRDTGNLEEMLETARRYVSTAGSGDAYAVLAEAYGLLGRQEEGVNTLRQAGELFPENSEIPLAIAGLQFDMGKIAEAQAVVQSLLKAGGADRSALVRAVRMLTDSYIYLGQFAKAKELLQESQRRAIESGNPVGAGAIHAVLGMLIAELRRDPAAAAAEFAQAEQYPDFWHRVDANFFTFIIRTENGERVNVDSLIIIDDPRVTMAFRSYQNARFGDCTLSAAQIDSIRMIMVNELKFFVFYNVAECTVDHGDRDRSITLIRLLRELPSRSNSWGALAYPRSFFLLAKVHDKAGDRKLAMENYRKFLEIWKDADRDLPDYREATDRLAELEKAA